MNRLRLSLTGFFGPNEHYLVAEQHGGIKIIYTPFRSRLRSHRTESVLLLSFTALGQH